MSKRLPRIDLAVKGEPKEVLRGLAYAAEQLGTNTVSVEVDSISADAMYIANIRCRQPAPHQDLGLKFIYLPILKDRIALEVHASRWFPEDPPMYETYVQAARDITAPILKAYNASHKTAYRIRIPKRESLMPNLTPTAQKLFATFIRHANTSALHPNDWARFYKFVWGSRGTPLHEEDMSTLLESNGFTSEYAMHVAAIYAHLCDFKGYK